MEILFPAVYQELPIPNGLFILRPRPTQGPVEKYAPLKKEGYFCPNLIFEALFHLAVESALLFEIVI